VEDGTIDPESSFVGFAFKALNISTGKSATPIVKLASVPKRAEAPPEKGPHGPSSV
jgi:hypothetical protein